MVNKMACMEYIVHPSNYIGQVIADDDGMEVLPTNKTLQCQTAFMKLSHKSAEH